MGYSRRWRPTSRPVPLPAVSALSLDLFWLRPKVSPTGAACMPIKAQPTPTRCAPSLPHQAKPDYGDAGDEEAPEEVSPFGIAQGIEHSMSAEPLSQPPQDPDGPRNSGPEPKGMPHLLFKVGRWCRVHHWTPRSPVEHRRSPASAAQRRKAALVRCNALFGGASRSGKVGPHLIKISNHVLRNVEEDALKRLI